MTTLFPYLYFQFDCSSEGPDHSKCYTVFAEYDNRKFSSEPCGKKKDARQSCAAKIIDYIDKQNLKNTSKNSLDSFKNIANNSGSTVCVSLEPIAFSVSILTIFHKF